MSVGLSVFILQSHISTDTKLADFMPVDAIARRWALNTYNINYKVRYDFFTLDFEYVSLVQSDDAINNGWRDVAIYGGPSSVKRDRQ